MTQIRLSVCCPSPLISRAHLQRARTTMAMCTCTMMSYARAAAPHTRPRYDSPAATFATSCGLYWCCEHYPWCVSDGSDPCTALRCVKNTFRVSRQSTMIPLFHRHGHLLMHWSLLHHFRTTKAAGRNFFPVPRANCGGLSLQQIQQSTKQSKN